jgi:lipopolysaccharide/colanic/teichoic acid biosynthesis glycosyltransferase
VESVVEVDRLPEPAASPAFDLHDGTRAAPGFPPQSTALGLGAAGSARPGLARASMRLKRGLDLVAATVGLLALAPVVVAVAVAIKLDGPGAVLYRQRRVGRHGRHFQMLKFRTMIPGADAMKAALGSFNEAGSGLFKIAADPRVTRVGRFLRRSALDELPQLLNVIRGEMSLVGPRPLVVEEDARIAGPHRRRLELMPGMTGPWQLLGPARASLEEMAAIDYRYVTGWSLWTDLGILLRTVPHVLGRRGL